MTSISASLKYFADATLQFERRAEQTMGMPATERRWWTRAEVLALMEAEPLHWPRYELVDGELLVTPSPAGIHQLAVGEILGELRDFAKRTGACQPLTSPSDVELEPGTLVQPDVYVISTAESIRLRQDGRAQELLLAIEVLSPGSGGHDRGRKRALYQRTVPEYWIVDLDARLIERWAPADTRPEIVRDQIDIVFSGSDHAFVFELQPFFAFVFGDTK